MTKESAHIRFTHHRRVFAAGHCSPIVALLDGMWWRWMAAWFPTGQARDYYAEGVE